MKACALLAIVFLLASTVGAEVSVSVYRPDGHTLLGPVEPNLIKVYPDIMVGTRLGLVVNSDTPGYWWGGLFMTWNNWVVGTLSARGESSGSPVSRYRESVLAAGGGNALVAEYTDPLTVGFDLVTGGGATAGEWFVLDYHAEQIGLCYVGLYDLDLSFDIPLETLVFSHVPSRDFNGDTLVNFMDFALLASQWGQDMISAPDADTSFDLNGDGDVGIPDMALFSEFWLERTDCNEPSADPDAPLP